MDCLRIAPLGFLLAATCLVAPMQSQSVPSQQEPQPDASSWRPIPQARPIHAPFPIKAKLPYTVEIHPATAISAQDQQLESNEENSIREGAGMRLMDFTPNGWSYSQIACPAFPGHLFLRFMRTEGKGD